MKGDQGLFRFPTAVFAKFWEGRKEMDRKEKRRKKRETGETENQPTDIRNTSPAYNKGSVYEGGEQPIFQIRGNKSQ